MVEIKKTVKSRTKANKTASKKSTILGSVEPIANSGDTSNSEEKSKDADETKSASIDSAMTISNKAEEKKVEPKTDIKKENKPEQKHKVIKYFTEFWNGMAMN